jgi:hypothetical protein
MKCRFRIRRTQWGWSLFHDGELVASADHPLELVFLPAYFQAIAPNWRGAHRQ